MYNPLTAASSNASAQDPMQIAQAFQRLPGALNQMGWDAMRPGQDQAVRTLISGRDLVCIMSTSGGKTGCYVLPTLARGWRTIIFSPLIALMQDQRETFLEAGVQAACITSLETEGTNRENLKAWMQGALDILLVAPERTANEEWCAAMEMVKPDMVVMDECFTADTEILTEFGFRAFHTLTDECRDLERGIKVAQVDPDNGSVSYVRPSRWVRQPFKGNLTRVHSESGVDLIMTPNHELLMYRYDGTWKKSTVEDAKFNHAWRFRAAASACPGCDELTPRERLQVAYQADGNRHSPGVAAFSFVKKRKIDRFLQLMEDGGFDYYEGHQGNQKRRRFFVKDTEDLYKRMRASIDYTKLSSAGCKALVEEAVAWDGSEVSDTMWYYSSTDEDNTDFYQEVCFRAGLRSRKTVQKDNRADSYQDVHRLFIRRGQQWTDTQCFEKEEVPYQGSVHCVTVPTGCIVVRYKGKIAVVGNCHTLSEWCDNFRPGYKEAGRWVKKIQPKVIGVFSATLPPEAEAEVCDVLGLTNPNRVVYCPPRTNLQLSCSLVPDANGNLFSKDDERSLIARTLGVAEDDPRVDSIGLRNGVPTIPGDASDNIAQWVVNNCLDGNCLIYCATRKRTEEMAERIDYLLKVAGYEPGAVSFYHGGLKPAQKKEAQRRFMSGEAAFMCATVAFGMGIDKPDIRYVIHRDLSSNIEAAMQEIGRGGRDNEITKCHMFMVPDSVRTQNFLRQGAFPTSQAVRSVFDQMNTAVGADRVLRGKFGELFTKFGTGNEKEFGTIMTIMKGSQILVPAADLVQTDQIEFLPVPSMPPAFIRLRDAIAAVGVESEADAAVIEFDIDAVAEYLGVKPATVRANLNKCNAKSYANYTRGNKGGVYRLATSLDHVNFANIDHKAAVSEEKFAKVLDYYHVPDEGKHAFLQDCMK